MPIKLLSIEGLDAAARAWRASRNISKPVSWREVFTLDLPVCEMPTCVLSFEDLTIWEREIFATPRNHVIWARTSHVDDPLQFTVPEDLAASAPRNFIADCRQRMRDDKEAGKSQDEWRRYLPMISTTSWTGRSSYRDLVKMAGYFMKLVASEAIDRSLRRTFRGTTDALGAVLDQFTGSPSATWEAIRAMRPVDFLSTSPISAASGMVAHDNFYVVTTTQPIWMRAQIVRHRPLAVVDTLWDVLASRFALEATIDTRVRVQMAADRQYWKSILSKRTCWLAQDDLKGRKDPWQEIIDAFGFDESMLPCAGGSCPYHRDAALRLTPDDPGAPCPRFITIAGEDPHPHVDVMLAAAGSRHPSWSTFIRDLVGGA